MSKNKRMGWTVAHTANSRIEQLGEEIVKDFLTKNWVQMLAQTEIPVEEKDAKKLIKSLKTSELMLVWRED